ncbi:MAG: hypothetical protein HC906_17645 [Bacteroidales bacterium]|nr:hypothetical protein [Bacteroidales bacterium]
MQVGLKADLVQTGKTFSTQISDNKGSFELKQIDLSSQFVELKADGFYFNESRERNSTAQLTLYAFSDLSEKNSLNINILSHLEKSRIDYLVSQGSSFSDAKKKAQKEILQVFSIEKSNIAESELLDISKDGDDNAILLAISVIIQGFRTDAELSELLANMSTDIREDGILNSSVLGSELINHAMLLNFNKIRENLKGRYDEMGVEANIPDFEKYVRIFTESSDFELTNAIDYPENGEYGKNILFSENNVFKSGNVYSMAANLPEGAELKVSLKGGVWFYEVMPSAPKNWKATIYDFENQYQEFTSMEPGKECDLKIIFELTGDSAGNEITIEYFENMSEMPTKSRTIVIEN